MPRASKSATRHYCAWQEYGAHCDRRAMYLVQAPFASYSPYCLAHVSRVLVQATDAEYRRRPAGHREPVAVLPIDER